MAINLSIRGQRDTRFQRIVLNVSIGPKDCPIYMNSAPLNTNIERRWTTYLKATAFLLPALFLWGVSGVFLFPKLQTIWRDAGFDNPTALRFMGTSNFLMNHAVFISVAIILILALLEWRNDTWPRYRGGCLGLAVFVLNSAVLVLLTAMLTT